MSIDSCVQVDTLRNVPVRRCVGRSRHEDQKPVVEAIHTAVNWTFTADTISPPQAVSPAKPSVIPVVQAEVPSEKEVSDMLWEMLLED